MSGHAGGRERTRSVRGLSIAIGALMAIAGGCGGDSDEPAPAVIVPPAPITFVSAGGDSVEAERGEIWVPENREDPDSRSISLAYFRFPSTADSPGSPIVYLAGGPGGSGIATARGRRFPLFMALREIADVIAFDQRGTGDSNRIPPCETDVRPSLDAPADADRLVAGFRRAAERCLAFWAEGGVDIAGYDTAESARDLEALRRALGTDRLSLWGISYGTHLAMAAIKEMGPRVDRVILASAEGLDQTVKLPARTDAYFERLQAAIDTDPEAAARFPDVAGMIRRVLDRLRAEPVTVAVRPESGGDPVSFVMGADEVQLYTGYSINDPANAAGVLRAYRAADEGDFSVIGRFVYAILRDSPVTMRGMPEAMDFASGMSAERRAAWEREAPVSLLGGFLNFPMPHAEGAFGDLDLGPEFRQGPETSVPTLLLTGTLDGRTYPESHLEATAGFSNLTHVVIENAGHNLFMVSPEVTDAILAFMRGEPVPATRLRIDLPEF